MKRILLIVAALALLALAACNNSEPDASSQPPGSPVITSAPELPSPSPSALPETDAVAVADQGENREYFDDGNELILKISISLPELGGEPQGDGFDMINDYYRSEIEKNLNYAETELYDMAINNKMDCDQNGFPFTAMTSEQSFEITRNRNGVLSLIRMYSSTDYSDTAEQGDTFNVKTGARITVDELFTVPDSEFVPRLVDLIIAKIGDKARHSDYGFLEDYALYARDSFDKDNFFLTDSSIGFFYGLHTIAPPELGVIRIEIPFSELGDIITQIDSIAESVAVQ